MRALFGDSMLSPELDARVRSELREHECLLWVGQPLPGRLARCGIPAVLFGIPWTAFAIFWTATAATGVFNGPARAPGWFGVGLMAFPLFGVPFVLIGFGMLSTPYWLWRRATKTCYALTDRRAIIIAPRSFRSVEVRSYGPKQLSTISRTEHDDGSGDLVFEENVLRGRDSDSNTATSTNRRGFMAIPSVREVEELLNKALLSAGSDERSL